jgi:hypothetical protein
VTTPERVDTTTGEVATPVPKLWTPVIAAALREPLPAEQVGKLPKVPKARQDQAKEHCRVCGGWHQPIPEAWHVDYIAHAIVTDKLNSIAGQDGWDMHIDVLKESKDGEHVIGILATLTIAGVSKQEAGDPGKRATWGEELKLAISDWLPRAAMRFGLGLREWAKQPLDKVIVEDGHETRQDGDPPLEAPPAQAPDRGETSPSPRSGSTVPLDRLRTPTAAQAYVRGQSAEWQEVFKQVTAEAETAGDLKGRSELDGYRLMIARTDERVASGVAA